jgi:hypothetical protein
MGLQRRPLMALTVAAVVVAIVVLRRFDPI